MRATSKEDLSSLDHVPGVEYYNYLINPLRTQRRLEKKLTDISDSDLAVGKIAVPTIKSDGSI